MSPDDGLLQHMLREARLALEFTDDLSQPEFLRDQKTQHAVIRCLEIIGEAASRISDARRAVLGSIPGREIIRQRHIAVHHYSKLEMPRIWNTVREHVPSLVAALERHLDGTS